MVTSLARRRRRLAEPQTRAGRRHQPSARTQNPLWSETSGFISLSRTEKHLWQPNALENPPFRGNCESSVRENVDLTSLRRNSVLTVPFDRESPFITV